jgi:diketogulonate reductase-like aldo/keto reductase
VLLRWALQRGTDAVIPKSATIQHIIDNLKVFDFHLSDEHMAVLSSFR